MNRSSGKGSRGVGYGNPIRKECAQWRTKRAEREKNQRPSPVWLSYRKWVNRYRTLEKEKNGKGCRRGPPQQKTKRAICRTKTE